MDANASYVLVLVDHCVWKDNFFIIYLEFTSKTCLSSQDWVMAFIETALLVLL